ncbi:MAG: TatD family hydrolase, partial [Candidatus Peregrinibacteria bacterium]|nr:TatD family hydrolase [Candidatus Peregrinibacteria bacterium]
QKAVELAEKYESGVYACIGIHPIHSDKSFHDKKELGAEGEAFTSRGEVYDASLYSELAKHPKVVAIGECGLDYYRLTPESKEKQVENFEAQIELAASVKKPLMLHIRNGSGISAYKDAFSILASRFSSLGSSPGNLHFFAGSIEEAKPFLEAGYTFSFTGVITFAREYDDIIRYLPLDRILSETDSPYVTPVPYRGKRNEPLYVQEVVKNFALIRGVPLEVIQEAILQNASRLFGIPL